MRAIFMAAALVGAATAHAQIYKCQEAGRTVYSQTQCDRGVLIDASRPSPKLPAELTQRREVDRAARLPPSSAALTVNREAPPQSAPVGSNCPTEQDIRNLETSASSMTFNSQRKERDFLYAEIRRARACSKEGGNYTQDDWTRIKDAQRGQNRIDSNDRARERAIAEGIHAPAASDRENARMENDKLREELRRANTLNCDATGCWSQSGVRYNRAGNTSTFFRQDGASCELVGTAMNCR